jgi:hypothetical protein
MFNLLLVIIFFVSNILCQEDVLGLDKIVEKDDLVKFEKIYADLEIDSPIDFIDSVTDLKADKIAKYIIAKVPHQQLSRPKEGLLMNKLLLKTMFSNMPLAHNEILRKKLYHLRTKDELGRNIIHELAKQGDLFLLDEIIRNNKSKRVRQVLNCKDCRGYKPFILTAYNARKDVAKLLYNKGTYLDQKDLNAALKIQLAHSRAEYDYIEYLFEIGMRPQSDLNCVLDSMFGQGAFGNRYTDKSICTNACSMM